MTIAKITAGDGYLYLTNHTAQGDTDPGSEHDPAAYYTAGGNPPGRWTGRGAPLLGLAGQHVNEDQMRALFGYGAHPEAGAMIDSYLQANVRAGMTGQQLKRVSDAAIRSVRLGRPFPAYQAPDPFEDRVQRRLAAIRQQTGRDPTQCETRKARAQEAARQRAAVAGFDLVFSPVKSAALLWALDERPWVREAVRDAHQSAMAQALALLEEHAAWTRTGAGGIAQIPTGGLIAAQFEHWDSRAGDPNLHTHVAVSAKARGCDGKWRSLDARALYRMTVAASETYNTAFEAALTASTGVTFTPRPDTTGGREPVREISDVSFSMIRFFSRRRAAIETRYAELITQYRDKHGHDPDASLCHRLARQANLDTRQGKKPPVPLADKRARWRQELTGAFGPGAVARLMAAVPSPAPVQHAAQAAAGVDLADLAERVVASVSARRSTWTVWNIRAEAERQLRAEVAGLTPQRHRELAEAITALAISPACSVSAEAPAMLDEPAGLRRPDGTSVFTEHAAALYTSRAVLDAEQRLVNATRTLTAAGQAGAAAAAALDGFEAVTGTVLDSGQRDLAAAFASSGRLLLAGIGPAGSGKTTAMRALARVLRQGGQRLVPLATSAASADVLSRELSIRAENLHKFLWEWTRGPSASRLQAGGSVPDRARPFRISRGDVILVDEAGMAGTFMLDELVTLAAARGAVVRLLGDDRQLPAVEGGGALRLIAAQPGTAQLTALYRFRDPAEAAATLKLRAGDATAIGWYDQAGRLRSGSREHMTQAAYDGWKADMLAGKVTLMAAADGAGVRELAARARADRVAAGQVEPGGIRLRDGNLAGAGDWIVTRRNDRRLPVFRGRDWVKNGDAWRIVRHHPDGSLTAQNLAHGGHVTLPAGYARDQVELLYATTAHRAQGTTVDTAHALITAGLTREILYVLATRARENTTLYTATHDLPFDPDARVNQARTDPDAYAAQEILLNIVSTEGSELSATETIEAKQHEAGSLATLVPRYLHAAHLHAETRYQQAAVAALGPAGGRHLHDDPAWPAVVRRLHDAEAAGWEPGQLLATVAAMRELATADSLAEVLAWRIDAHLADFPSPPAHARSESGGDARNRLAGAAASALGPQLVTRARSETGWPALISALLRAENAGTDVRAVLASAATSRELGKAPSISEALAARIGQHLNAAQPREARAASRLSAGVLPWVASPRLAHGADDGLAGHLKDAAALIAARIEELADTAARHRPPWMHLLGCQPDDASRGREWLRHVAVIAAYRDQYKVTGDDPRQILGPYAEPGRSGHTAYWHAANSVLAARRLTGLEPAAVGADPDQAVRAQVAGDIYLSLPGADRADIAARIAACSGGLWLGNPAGPDETAAIQPCYAPHLIAELTRRGFLTGHGARRLPREREPVEAAFARRRAPRPGQDSERGPSVVSRPALQIPSLEATSRGVPMPRRE